MPDKSLADKAISIQGKSYVLVSDRIIYFNEQYPNGSITTELVSDPMSDIVIIKATIYPSGIEPDMVTTKKREDGDAYDVIPIGSRYFTGYSQAVKGAGFINKTSALENAETSAVGRALAMMGIGVIDSVASVDEINKAKGTDPDLAKKKAELFQAFKNAGITDFDKQKLYLSKVLDKETVDSVSEADKVIKDLNENQAAKV